MATKHSSFQKGSRTGRERHLPTPNPRIATGRRRAAKPKNWNANSAKEAPIQPVKFFVRAEAVDEKRELSPE